MATSGWGGPSGRKSPTAANWGGRGWPVITIQAGLLSSGLWVIIHQDPGKPQSYDVAAIHKRPKGLDQPLERGRWRRQQGNRCPGYILGISDPKSEQPCRELKSSVVIPGPQRWVCEDHWLLTGGHRTWGVWGRHTHLTSARLATIRELRPHLCLR